MIDKRELKRLNNKIGKYLDPLALFLLFAVFILPALAVINLSPQSKPNLNVLGTKSTQELSFVLVGGVHDFLKEERILFPTTKMTQYEAVMIKHQDGEYSKPILQIKNTYNTNATIEITGGTVNPTNSDIYVIFDGKEYLIQDKSGSIIPTTLTVKDNYKGIAYLKFTSDSPLKFNENVNITFIQK